MAVIKGTVTPEASIGGTVNVQKTVIAESNAEMIDARTGHDGNRFKTMGEAIRTQVTNLWNAVNGKLSVETDPTVPAWAKAEVKPSYTADEVGAVPVDHLEDLGNPHSVNFLQVGSVKIEKVWENASPTSSFVAQTVTLDLADADMVLIDYKATDTTSVVDSKIIKVGNASMLSTNYNNVSTSQAIVVASRSVTVSTTGIAFEQGFTKKPNETSASGNNVRAIPVAIYAIKGVQK